MKIASCIRLNSKSIGLPWRMFSFATKNSMIASKMHDFYMLVAFFGYIIVFSQFSCTTVIGGSQNLCPNITTCSCSYTHRIVSGKPPSTYVNAICSFREGSKLTDIPQKLPPKLGKFIMDSQNVGVLKHASLRNYPFLYELYLKDNNIRSIEPGSFHHQKDLELLWLQDNKLINISRETFEGLKTLNELRLDHNKLQRIFQGTFSYTPLLRKLDLRNNTISVLEEGAFDELDYLENILLSFNSLTTINKGVFGNLMSLKTLELASNGLKTIDGNAFDCAPVVNKLVLNGNKLDKIPAKVIANLKFLEFLYVNNNPLELIEADAFKGLRRLTTIELSHCKISSIQNGSFDDLGHLEAVHVRNNPLNCNCHLRWLPTWLSRRPGLTFDGAICHKPNDISGTGLTSANLTSFVCSCAACKMDANCIGESVNCSCPDNWAGSSCSDTCQSDSGAVGTCQNFGGKCFCGRNITTKPLSRAICSFNITSAKCSENGELKKNGSRLECKCNIGFEGNGSHCTDINECNTGKHFCLKHSVCINTQGSHRCECQEGFTEEVEGLCMDVNECSRQKPCHVNATCYNSLGMWSI